MGSDSVSIFIPAYNEEKSIKQSITTVQQSAESCRIDYEIIIVNDGSSDTTPAIIQQEAKKNKRISIIHHPQNRGLGVCVADAIAYATKTYFTGYPGDGDVSGESLKHLIQARQKKTIILPYLSNQQDRPLVRKLLSLAYTRLLNFLFRLHLKYYNGYCLAPLEDLRTISLLSQGHTIAAEIAIRLIKKGYQYQEIPFQNLRKNTTRTKVSTPANIYRVLNNLIRLFIDIQLRKRY